MFVPWHKIISEEQKYSQNTNIFGFVIAVDSLRSYFGEKKVKKLT